MMNNSVKYLRLERRALIKAFGINDSLKKDNTFKKSIYNRIIGKLRDYLIYYEVIDNNNILVFSDSVFQSYLQISFDWDKMSFGKSSDYYNVYDFEKFWIEKLKRLVPQLNEDFGILNYQIIE